MAGEDELGDEKTEIRAESPLLPVSPAQPSQPDAEGRGRDDDQDGRDPGEIPVWRTALDRG